MKKILITIFGLMMLQHAMSQNDDVVRKSIEKSGAGGNPGDYKNAVTFITVGAGMWAVPEGVIRIKVEAWGGGGGGSGNGSGAGGGYVSGIFSVAGGNVSYTIGAGGTSGSPGTGGGSSTATFSSSFFISGLGGEADNSAVTFNVAAGGLFSGNPASGFYGEVGEAGSQNRFEGYQLNPTTYRESQTGGKGGDGGNTTNTGGKGGYLLRDGTTSKVIYGFFGGHGRMPGGGGGSAGIWGGSLKNGGQGMVIIHY